jgi:uncharacterized membrane protein YozB (DUF420 family)
MDLFVSQINLVFQIIILAIFSTSFLLKKMKKLFLHGITMAVATILSLISFLLVMFPSLLSLNEFLVNYPYNQLAIIVFAHSILGAIVEILALALVITWRLRSNVKYCSRKKILMRVTFILWLVALILGILVYLYAYGYIYF